MTSSSHNLSLPPELVAQIAACERRLRRIETIVAAGGALGGLLLSIVALYVSDRFWDTPALLRIVSLGAGALALGLAAWYWLRHRYWKRRDGCEMSRLIQRHYRQFGDRLLGVIELVNADDLPDDMSSDLCRAAIDQVAAESATVDFTEAVDRRPARDAGGLCAAVLIVVAVVALLSPSAAFNVFERWLQPLADIERYTFVNLEPLPAELNVAHGEPIALSTEVSGDSRWIPSQGRAVLTGQRPITFDVDGRVVSLTVPGQTQEVPLAISVGDAQAHTIIRPRHRPALTRLVAQLTLPEYLQRSKVETTVDGSKVRMLESSQVSFEGEVSRILQQGELTASSAATTKTAATAARTVTTAMTVEGKQFVSLPVPAQDLVSCRLTWRDTFGLAPKQARVLKVVTVADRKPEVRVLNLVRHTAILEDETLEIEVKATDDFGLRHANLAWLAKDGEGKELGLGETATVADGGSRETSLSGTFVLSPEFMDLPIPCIVELYAATVDYLPGRQPATTELYRVDVLSYAQHAEQVRRQFEALLTKLEDLARGEESLLDGKQQLQALSDEDLQTEASTSSMRRQLNQGQLNRNALDRAAETGRELLAEAMRNKQFPTELLARLAETVSGMQSLSQAEMTGIVKSMQAGLKKEGAARRGEVQEAATNEVSAVKKLRGMAGDMDKSLKDMVARNFILRLRQLGAGEGKIMAALEQALPRTIGMRTRDLEPKLAEQLEKSATQQYELRRESRFVQDDIQGYAIRTGVDAFREIHSEMTEAHIQESLAELTECIASNQLVKAMADTDGWAKRFNAWAARLESSGGRDNEGGGGDSRSAAAMRIIMDLLRIAQQEDALRIQTRATDRLQAGKRQHKARSRRLLDKQLELLADINVMTADAWSPLLYDLLEEVAHAMDDAGELLERPQTDSETIAAETEVIELLTRACGSCQSQCNSAAAGMLAQMMAQLAKGRGKKPGQGSVAGGESNFAGDAQVDGQPAAGAVGEARSVEKTSGRIDPATVPEEFREAVEQYFRAMEELEE
ncbi:MAG: hypothetical protein QF541_10020 [Lentisphaeria bacterium]|nr:hypothetical protein [Lentisphaeria bacterium]